MWDSKWDLAESNLPFFVCFAFRLGVEEHEKVSGRNMPSFGYNSEKGGEAVSARQGFAGSNEAQ